MEYLNINKNFVVDNSVWRKEFHSYDAQSSKKFEYNDEIIISIQETGKYTLPCESFLYIEGMLTDKDNKPSTKLNFVNNGIAFLFKEIRYQINGVTVDSVRDVGLTSTMKGYVSYTQNEMNKLLNAGWTIKTDTEHKIVDVKGNFNVCIPMHTLMGFFEDFKTVLLNARQELILVRTNDDKNAVISTDANDVPKVAISKLEWIVPHVVVDIEKELAFTKLINKGEELIIGFRSWELVEYPELTKSTRHNWPVKTSTKVETPRHIILGLQTNRRGNLLNDMSKFDHCNLRNIRVFLNSDKYPYSDLYLDFDNNRYAYLYEFFSSFRKTYYEDTIEPVFNSKEFKETAPIAYINCMYQKEILDVGAVALRLEIETDKEIPEKTSAYCLILHDKMFTYNPLTKIVRQI